MAQQMKQAKTLDVLWVSTYGAIMTTEIYLPLPLTVSGPTVVFTEHSLCGR